MSGTEGKGAHPRHLDRIHHVAVEVPDVALAVAWYLSRFRCGLAYQDDTWALLTFENASLALVTRGDHPPHFGVEGPAIGDEKAARLHRDGVRYVYIEDPGGNVVEIVEENPEKAPLRP